MSVVRLLFSIFNSNLRIFLDAGIDVIRIGLCASDNLSDASTCYAGPNHPSLGELVENELYYNLIKEQIDKNIGDGFDGHISVTVAKGALSKAIGQKKRNKFRLADDYDLKSIAFYESEDLSGYQILVMQEERIK